METLEIKEEEYMNTTIDDNVLNELIWYKLLGLNDMFVIKSTPHKFDNPVNSKYNNLSHLIVGYSTGIGFYRKPK